MAATGGGGSVNRAGSFYYRRLLNFDSPLAAIGLDNMVPKGEEKLLKSSFYQAATMFILAFGLAGVYSLYFILSPFAKPILWAVLVGTVLHPVKLAINKLVRNWLGHVGSRSSVPILSLHVAMSPLTITLSLLSYVRTTMTKFMLPLTAVSFAILLICAIVRFDFPITYNYFTTFLSIFDIIGDIWAVILIPWPAYLTAFLAYAIAVIILPPKYWHPIVLQVLSIIWWILLFFLVSKVLGPFTFLLLPALVIPVGVKLAEMSSKDKTNYVESLKRPSLRSLKRASEFLAALSPRFSRLAKADLQSAFYHTRKNSDSESSETGKNSKPANIIIMAVIWAVVIVRLLSYPILITILVPFLLLPPVICFIANLDCVTRFVKSAVDIFGTWLETRRNGFIPPSIAKLGKYLVKGDKKIRKMLESCVESCVTAILIVGVVALFAFTIFFGVVQLHRETVYMFTMSNEILNRTLHPEVNRWLESNNMNVSALHDVATNAADFGRKFFNSTVDAWIHAVPDVHREQLKLQLLNAYDLMSNQFFESWSRDFGVSLYSNPTNLQQPDEPQTLSLGSLFDLNITGMMEIGMSIWAVLKENAGLFLAIFTHIASALMICSWAVFGYVVSSVVFLTTLYYLLVASGDTYKPVQLLISLTPFDNEINGTNIVGRAVDSGIRGVFIATFKMIIFYGLYTWFLHSVFEIGIAFIPSICAAILAAVPIVGAYWASILGVFQLWLISGRGFTALLFFGLHMLPMYFVDVLIYTDIKGGGHPYLTGLAIVGGVSCLGFEGAILGPVLLCLIVILMNLYRGVLHASPPGPPIAGNTQVTNEEGPSQPTGPTPSVHQTSRRLGAKSLTVPPSDLVTSTTSLPDEKTE